MKKIYHTLLNALIKVNHPFPEIAVKRAIYARNRKKKGAGLTKIPLSIIQEEYSSKSQAQKTYDIIDDNIDNEAAYLARRDEQLEIELGFEDAVSYYYGEDDVDVDKDITNLDLKLKLAPEVSAILMPDQSIPRDFQNILTEAQRVFKDDSVRGYDRSDADRKRLTKSLRTLITRIGEISA